jgi:predicted permease
MHTLLPDLRYGVRMLLKSPGVTVLAVLSLALGIGANTTIFSVANGLLLRPLPVEEPDRLVALFTRFAAEDRNSHSSYPDYKDLRDRNTVFSGVAAHFYYPIGLKARGQAEVVMAQTVTWNYFNVLGVKPVLGRTFFRQEDETPDARAVAILSHRAWQNRFASDAEIIGKTVLLNNYPFTVVGVAPRGFSGLCSFLAPEVFVPVMMSGRVSMFPVDFNARGRTMLKLVARLKPGVSLAQAQAATEVLAANLAREYPNTNRDKRFPLVEADRNRVGWLDTTDTIKKLMFMVLVVVGLVLLIACGNVANLLLARVAGRQREVAVRLALGATRGRIVRQFLTESLLLAALGCGLGLLLAAWGVDLFKALGPGVIEFRMELDAGLDRGVLAYTLLLGLASAVVFGLAPALQSARTGQCAALKGQSLSVSPGRSKTRLQSGLVAAQLALSLVLLISTGLCLRSLGNTLAVHPGFEARNGFVLPLNLGYGQYDEAKGRQFQRQVVERVTALPGVRSAALTLDTPLGQLHVRNGVAVEGYQPRRDELMVLRFNAVGPRYFETLGIPVLRGRPIDQRDTASSRRVAVVNEAMARRYWPGREPLGRTFRCGGASWEIVGVIKDGKYDSLSESPQPYYCLPLSQIDYFRRLDFHVRAEGDPRSVIPAVLREIQQLDSSLPISNVMTHTRFLENSVQFTAGPAKLVGPFSVLALALALVGVYGVMSHAVSRRTHELAVRMALGAGRGDVLRLVLRQGLRTTLVGLVLGLAGAFAATRALAGFLYQVNTLDPAIFAGVSLVLAAVAMLACLVPALRATRLQPASALRVE